jgi:hypothetical protein
VGQCCFPNWRQSVWLWWGCSHASWSPDEITVSDTRRSLSSVGMTALRATIQIARPELNRSLTRLPVHHIPTTLDAAHRCVNGPVPATGLRTAWLRPEVVSRHLQAAKKPGVDRWAASRDEPCWEPRGG